MNVNRKKVGIMSMQRIYNYGSFLQAYALKKIISKLGYDVTFIDYHPGKVVMTNNKYSKSRNQFDKIAEVMRIHSSLSSKLKYLFYKKNFGKKYYSFLGLTDEPQYEKNVDTLVIGSDEVFNCLQNSSDVGFSTDLFGENYKADRIISYAASFGSTTLKKIKDYALDKRIALMLTNNFKELSVRDQNSFSIVNQLTGRIPKINLDPVLIYNFNTDHNVVMNQVDYQKKYMIVYGYTGRFSENENKKIKQFARKKNLQIVGIGGLQSCCDVFWDLSPFQVINAFKSAEYIVTDTFHGTILSIIQKRPFVTIIREGQQGNEQKLGDLLNRLNLTNRKLTKINNLEQVIRQSINYRQVSLIIDQAREETNQYLQKAL
jgi:hypothetical protein